MARTHYRLVCAPLGDLEVLDMSLLRQRANSGSSREDLDEVLSEHDEEEEHRGLLQEDDYDASKFKIPALKQQMLIKSVQSGGGFARICLIMSVLGIVFLSTIAIGISSNTLFWERLYAEEEDRKLMIDGLAGAIVIYAITGSFSFLLVYASSNRVQLTRRFSESLDFDED